LKPDPPRIYRIENGRASYEASHIPGANFLDFVEDLSDSDSSFNFMMPAPETLADVLAAHGVGDDSDVVLYSRENIQWATRVWWMMRAIGFDGASVLDGGIDKWEAEGRPTSEKINQYPAATLSVQSRTGLFCDKSEVLAGIKDNNICIINALRETLHDGSEDVDYGRPGRIPGSTNVPGVSLLNPETRSYRPLDELETVFREAGALDADRVLIYCGGGIAASSDAFILTLLGKTNVGVYDASMSEWAKDPTLPMETG
jgi:thiosulfate/3-mercaptopyruvate sulfurtransferase